MLYLTNTKNLVIRESSLQLMLFSSKVVIALLQSNIFSTLPTDDGNVSDGKENELETNRKSHPATDDEVYEEIMNCLRSKLMLKCRHIMSNDEKKYIGF